MHIIVETPIVESPRVEQLRGLFDLPEAGSSRLEWDVELPLEEKPWHIGLIVGPSGCGKSTLARRLFAELAECDALGRPAAFADWVGRGAVVDAFPHAMGIKDIALLLSSVGFSSPPAWLRPFHVLSTGEQFRVSLALLLAHAAPGQRVVCDEFTSAVERTVAQIGSAALAKAVRARGQQFVAVTCHEDVEAWLQPDWVYRPAEGTLTWRLLRHRPFIHLDIVRCRHDAWDLFAPHHYLSQALNRAAVCFLATWRERPVAFTAWLPFVGARKKARREHRTVTLPDYQGVGIGMEVSNFAASLWKGLGYRVFSTTTHPALIQARRRSGVWRMHRRPSFVGRDKARLRHAMTRLTAGFTYTGPALPSVLARALLEVTR
jgi:energy-coupling factor transporter ATP-binding protein EcfA2